MPCEKWPICVVLIVLYYFNGVNPGVLRQAPPLTPVIRDDGELEAVLFVD